MHVDLSLSAFTSTNKVTENIKKSDWFKKRFKKYNVSIRTAQVAYCVNVKVELCSYVYSSSLHFISNFIYTHKDI